jgi:hypothetical protein
LFNHINSILNFINLKKLFNNFISRTSLGAVSKSLGLNSIIDKHWDLEIATFNLLRLKKNVLSLGKFSGSDEVIEIIVIGASCP